MKMKTGFGNSFDNDSYDQQEYPLSYPTSDKSVPFNTFLHYSDPTARQERTVFGAPKKGLFYNYSDRLGGKRWFEGWELAKQKGLTPKTALFYECVLNHFHDSADVDLQHVILGCNMSNGFDYLVFGYTYTSKSNQ